MSEIAFHDIYRRLALAILLCCLAAGETPAREVAGATALPDRQLAQLAMALRDSPEPLRADFARLAISEMALSYAEEAAYARREARQGSRDRDLPRWSVSVDAYAASLADIANSVTTLTPVTLAVGPDTTIYLYIDGKPVIINSPRSGQQQAFEQRVIEAFCSLHICDALLVEPLAGDPARTPAASTTNWSFSQHAGPVCMTDDGLEFQFRNMSDLGQKRAACDRVVNELNSLASAIAWRITSGTRVDWNALAIRALGGSLEYEVVLNSAGDMLQLSLPALAATGDLFRLVRPWLAAKVDGNSYRLVVINAGRLLAPAMVAGE